ncbi:hypothetical protein B7463_g5236, partial [Scytalidium lignicola]
MASDNLQMNACRLFDAVSRSDVAAIRDVLSLGIDIETRDPVGRTALHLAIIAASTDTIQCLLKNGALVNAWTNQGEATVHLAAFRGDVSILKMIMRALGDRQPTGINKKSVHVDCLDRKRQISALHIAVALAYVDMVEVLLSTYHADVNLPIGKNNPNYPTASVSILWLALQHPHNSCQSLVKLLLQHGASLVDKKTNKASNMTLPLILVRELNILDTFQEFDSVNLIHILTKVVWKQSMECNSALTLAIRSGLQAVAMELLRRGAPSQLTLDSTVDYHVDFCMLRKSPLEVAQEWFWQPILVAAEYEMPKLMIELLDRGADPHTTLNAEQAREMIFHSHCRTSLDIVAVKLTELRTWRGEYEDVDFRIKGTDEETEQLTGKENAIKQLIREYEEVEARLISSGVRMTDGLNLQTTEEESRRRKRPRFSSNNIEQVPVRSLETLSVDDKGLDISTLNTPEEGYIALSTACKENDLAMLKALTLKSWGLDSKFLPIAVAEKHTSYPSPFVTAVVHKHYDLARIMVYIAAAQYAKFNPLDFVLGQDVCSTLANDSYSPESLKALSKVVKCSTSAKQMVTDLKIIFEIEKKHDMEMLQFALDIELSFPFEQNDITRRTRHAWVLVQNGDSPNVLDRYIRATGAPFKHATIHGKLEVRTQLDTEYQMSPILHAARSGNMHMVKYFLEPEKAMDAYREFAANNQFDLRKGNIEQVREQFLNAADTWLNKRSNLVLHSAVTSRNIELVQFLALSHPDLFEVKSVDGWTPLLVAAILQRLDFLRILLDNGANIFTTDNLQRNMIHLLLSAPGNGGGIIETEKLCTFIRSLDSSIRTQLLQQPCTDSPGDLTPFARWLYAIKQIEYIAPEADDLFMTVLELCDVSVMETFDATGNTPLHIVTKHSLEKLIRPIAQKAPHVLFFEGVAGKTPIDLVRKNHLDIMLEGIISRYARDKRLNWPRAGQIMHRPLFSFSSSYAGPVVTRDSYAAWEVVQEIVQDNGLNHPRRLITKEEVDKISEPSKKKKKQKQPRGNEGDEISLAIYRPGNLY